MHFRWKVVQQHCAVSAARADDLPASSSVAADMGISGEQDQVGCAGWMAEKQMMQSGYGGILSSRMRREVRSSAFGSSLRYLLELGSVCFDSDGCDGSVSPPSNFGARRLPLGPP